MNPHLIAKLFPGASKSLLAVNAGDFGDGKPDERFQPKEVKPCATQNAPKGKAVSGHTASTNTVPSTDEPTVSSDGAAVVRPDSAPKSKKIRERRRRVMNRTEREFSNILQARMRANEIVSWEFEGITLRWGNDEAFSYTADFVIVESLTHVPPITEASFPHVRLTFIEIKGRHIWKNDSTRFRHARDNFPLYDFQMWQKDKTGWNQIR